MARASREGTRAPKPYTEASQSSQRTHKCHRGFTEYSPRLHRGFTEDAQRTHRGSTEVSQGVHRGLTEDHRIHRGHTEDPQVTHKKLSEDPQRSSQRIHRADHSQSTRRVPTGLRYCARGCCYGIHDSYSALGVRLEAKSFSW